MGCIWPGTAPGLGQACLICRPQRPWRPLHATQEFDSKNWTVFTPHYIVWICPTIYRDRQAAARRGGARGQEGAGPAALQLGIGQICLPRPCCAFKPTLQPHPPPPPSHPPTPTPPPPPHSPSSPPHPTPHPHIKHPQPHPQCRVHQPVHPLWAVLQPRPRRHPHRELRGPRRGAGKPASAARRASPRACPRDAHSGGPGLSCPTLRPVERRRSACAALAAPAAQAGQEGRAPNRCLANHWHRFPASLWLQENLRQLCVYQLAKEAGRPDLWCAHAGGPARRTEQHQLVQSCPAALAASDARSRRQLTAVACCRWSGGRSHVPVPLSCLSLGA